MASITTELTARLAIDHPILLAPMGDAAGGHLAAAVSRAGGLGLIGGGYADPSWLEPQLDAAGDARVGVGFITFALDERPDTLTMVLERTPVAVQLSFGDPGPYADRIHASGALLICQVQTKAEAIQAVRCGADVIVAQGQDSGGHGRSGRGTIGLAPAIVDAVGPLPVVAAGGIADGRGLAAALMLGAAGITLGTRLLAATEAICDPTAAELLVARGGDDTTRTEAFDVIRGPAWPADCDGRALRNDITDRWDREPLGPTERERLAELYRRAPAEDYSIKALWAGDALDLIHAIEPAGDVIATVIDDALRLLESAAAAVRSEARP
jgi:nitronate monooxygenase